jgi:hypothetical protein
MALKSDRYEFQTDISYFMTEVGIPGRLVFLNSTIVASGAALDDTGNLASHTFASGRMPIGILMSSVVNIDTTRYHLNYHKDEVDVNVSPKVRVLRKGWVVTDQIIPATVTPGQDVFPSFSGYLTNSGLSAGGQPYAIGKFLSSKDSAGYSKVEINLP